MQKHAEEAMKEHVSNLQRIFFKEQKRNKAAPFYDLEKEDVENVIKLIYESLLVLDPKKGFSYFK